MLFPTYTSLTPSRLLSLLFFFFFNDPATTEIYTLSLHDALPIYPHLASTLVAWITPSSFLSRPSTTTSTLSDRKSTRLNSSHPSISYAVFCLKKKKKKKKKTTINTTNEIST